MIWGTFESEEHRIVEEKFSKIMSGRNVEMGLYNGEPTFCTVNAYSDCPYCDQCGICHIEDPMKDCDEFGMFFDYSWDEWLSLGDTPNEGEDADKF